MTPLPFFEQQLFLGQPHFTGVEVLSNTLSGAFKLHLTRRHFDVGAKQGIECKKNEHKDLTKRDLFCAGKNENSIRRAQSDPGLLCIGGLWGQKTKKVVQEWYKSGKRNKRHKLQYL